MTGIVRLSINFCCSRTREDTTDTEFLAWGIIIVEDLVCFIGDMPA